MVDGWTKQHGRKEIVQDSDSDCPRFGVLLWCSRLRSRIVTEVAHVAVVVQV